jgi:ketosteroid isomerase-like protein
MSQEDVEIVRKLYECLNRRDWDGMAELCDSGVELRGTIGGLEEGKVILGVAGIRRVTEEEDTEVWDEHLITPGTLIDAGQQVAVVQREYHRGKSSGVEIVADTAVVIDVRDGRVVRIQPYMNPAAALAAVGLSEQDARRLSSG